MLIKLLKTLSLLVLMTGLSAWGIVPMVSLGDTSICFLDVHGVKCFGNYGKTPVEIPPLTSPKQISVGDEHFCALDAEGVKCWGKNTHWQLNVPALKSPIQVSTGDYFTCALDAEGVKCWGVNDYRELNVPALKSPTQVTVGRSHACAIDSEGVKCWGVNDYRQLNVPALKLPFQIDADQSRTCALDAEGMMCWGGGNEAFRRPVQSPSQVCAEPCVIENGKLNCWNSYTPNYTSATQLSCHGDIMCVIDSAGVTCWTNTSYMKVPEVPSWYVDMARIAIPKVNSVRAEYLKAFTDIVPPALEREYSVQYLEYVLVAPAINSVDSAYFNEEFIPKFKEITEELQHVLGYSSSDDIKNIPDNNINRKIGIRSIQSALSVSLNFLSPELQASVQESIRIAGAASADPKNKQKIINLIQKIDALKLEKQKLKSSPKSAFLVDTLELAANWLREKVT